MEQILNNIYFMCLAAYAVTFVYDYLVLKLTVKVSEEPIGKFDVVGMLVPGVNVLLGCWWTYMLLAILVLKLIILIDDVVIEYLTHNIKGMK